MAKGGILSKVGAAIAPTLPAVERAEAALADAGAALKAVRAEHEAASAEHQAALAAEDRERATKARARRDELAEIDFAIAEARVTRLEGELAAAREQEAADAVQRLFDEADRTARAYRDAYESEMPAITDSVRGLMRLWAEAEQARRRAAAASPDEVATSVDAFRGRPTLERQEISRRRLDLWLNPLGGGLPYDDELQARVQEYQDGSGSLPPSGHGNATRITWRQKHEETIFYPAIRGEAAVPLPAALSIPAARAGDYPGWRPLQGSDPAAVLAALDALEAGAPAAAEREVETARVPIEAKRQVARE